MTEAAFFLPLHQQGFSDHKIETQERVIRKLYRITVKTKKFHGWSSEGTHYDLEVQISGPGRVEDHFGRTRVGQQIDEPKRVREAHK